MKKIPILFLFICLVFRTFAGSHNNTGGKNSQNDCSVTITVNTSWSSICPGGSVTITASGGATYSWNDGETTATITVSPGSSTLYMVTGTDTGGCTGTASSMVNVDNFTVAEGYAYSESCDNLPIVFNSAVVGGISPFTYHWKADGSGGSGDTITNYSSSAYDYALLVTDSLGCHSSAESPYIPRYEFYAYLPDTAKFCNDYGDPKANTLSPTIVDGKGPYTYNWNTGDTAPTIYPDAPGLFSVILTDGSGCSQTFSCHVTFPAAPVVIVTASSNDILPGTADTLTALGAEKYYWSNGMTGSSIIIHPVHTIEYSVYGWDTIVGTGSAIPTTTITTEGCGSPWQGIPVIVSNNPWRPSFNTPYTDTSSIYTLGKAGIGLQVPNYKLEVNGTVAADSNLLVGKVNSGQGIRINGDSATITSPTKTVSFGNDTVATTGTVKAGGMQVGYFQADSIKTGIINMPDSILKFGDPMSLIIRPCFPVEELTCNGYEFFGQSYGVPTQLGIGISPRATLHVGCNNSEPYQFLIEDPSSNTNMFTIDRYGNTYVAGNVGIATTQPDAVLSIANPTSPLSYQFSINNSSSDVFTIDKSGNTFAAGNVGIGTTTPDGVLSIENPSTPLSYQFSINNGTNDVFTIGENGETTLGSNSSSNIHQLQIVSSSEQGNFNYPLEGYISSNASNFSSAGYFNVNSDGSNDGASAILTDIKGNMFFMNYPSSPGYGNYSGPFLASGFVNMVSGPEGVIITHFASCNGGGSTSTNTLYPSNFLTNGYIFAVEGSMMAEELLVKPGPWCDYVFDNQYNLMTINDLEKYILENKHLPDLPSASQVKNEGIKVGEMDATMVKKIEELTLYTIQLKQQLDEMQAEIDKLKKSK